MQAEHSRRGMRLERDDLIDCHRFIFVDCRFDAVHLVIVIFIFIIFVMPACSGIGQRRSNSNLILVVELLGLSLFDRDRQSSIGSRRPAAR